MSVTKLRLGKTPGSYARRSGDRHRHIILRNARAILPIISLITIVGCSKTENRGIQSREAKTPGVRSTEHPATGPRTVNGHIVTESEFKYGLPATRNDKVVYQDDVVIVDGGADSIRTSSSNGINWTIDARAGHTDEIQVGKIIFLTSRAAGRVLGLSRKTDTIEVTLGPFELTELIKDVDISFDQRIEPTEMIGYSAPDFPGSMVEPPSSQQENLGPALKPSSYSFGDPGPAVGSSSSVAAALAGPPPQIELNGFQLTPFCCGGMGMRVSYDQSGVKFQAYAVLRLENPSLHFNLAIHGGRIQKANVELAGASGLTMQFEAGSAVGADGNIRKQFQVPVDLSIPIFGLPVPLAVTVHQSFTVITGFSSKDSVLQATGDYTFKGSVYAGYQNGSWGVGAPTSLSVKQSLLQSVHGVALGPAGLVMAYQARTIVGVGAFGFVTGPYIGYGAAVGGTRMGEAVGSLGDPCRTADLSVDIVGGVGYLFPAPMASLINSFLHALNIKPISNFGGLQHREKLISKHDAIPKGCA